jgi:hypothetical protein
MPRQLHKIISKEDPKKVIHLSALGYQEALEEALDQLGWTLHSKWDVPYDAMFVDEHMMSLYSQKIDLALGVKNP